MLYNSINTPVSNLHGNLPFNYCHSLATLLPFSVHKTFSIQFPSSVFNCSNCIIYSVSYFSTHISAVNSLLRTVCCRSFFCLGIIHLAILMHPSFNVHRQNISASKCSLCGGGGIDYFLNCKKFLTQQNCQKLPSLLSWMFGANPPSSPTLHAVK